MRPRNFIEKQKKLYKTLKPCYCPAIQDTVHFNAEGLKHLLYDRHRPRNISQKLYRVHLVDYLRKVIENAQKAKKKTFAEPVCCLWALGWVEITDKNKEKLKIKIILIKRGNGNVYFWSVMRKNHNAYKKNNTTKKTSS